MPKPAASQPIHAAHDETLIVRLFGGDVDERERARATALVADCDDCAALFADLGAMADATASLPVPVRPRDFALTEEDAARLRPHRGRWARIPVFGRARSLGGALVALGFSGLLVTSALSMLGSNTAQPALNDDAQRQAVAVGTAAPAGDAVSLPGAVPAATVVGPKAAASTGSVGAGATNGVETAAATPTPAPATAPSPAAFGPVSSDSHELAVVSATPAPSGENVAGALTPTTPFAVPAGSTGGESGPDVRLLALGVSGALLAFGFIVLLVPIVRRRSRGRASR